MSGRSSGSSPYSVVESKAVDRRAAPWPAREQVEAPVGALRAALAREHAGRVLLLAPVRVHARRVGEVAGQVLLEQEREQVAPVAVLRHRELRHLVVAQRLGVVGAADLAAAHRVRVLGVGRGLRDRGPAAQQLEALAADRLERVVVGGAQPRPRGIARRRRARRPDSARAARAARDRRARAAPRRGCWRGSPPRRDAAGRPARAGRSRRSRRGSACGSPAPARAARRVRSGPGRPPPSARPPSPDFSSSLRHSAANRRFTPGSLKRLAMVGNTGIASSGSWNAVRLRRHCLRTSRSASSAPRFSNLLSAISSAKSSMSIFSSWLAAPYSLVIT